MRASLSTVALIGVLFSQTATATWRQQPPFPCPNNIQNECTPFEQQGFDWQDLPDGDFSDYKGYQFSGWKCGQRPGKGGKLGKRTFGDKCIQSEIDRDTFTNTISCPSKQFSIGEMEISIGGLKKADLEIHYVMEDGSVCRKFAPCSEDGDIILNDQCGGAKQVKIKIPKQFKNQKCQIFVHKIKFVCGNTITTVPVPTTTIPIETPTAPAECTPGDSRQECQTSTTQAPSETAPAECTPGDNREECQPSTTQTPSEATTPAQTSATTTLVTTTEIPPPLPSDTTPPVTTEAPPTTTEAPPLPSTPPTECNPSDTTGNCQPTTVPPPPSTETGPSAECNPGNPAYNSEVCATNTSTTTATDTSQQTTSQDVPTTVTTGTTPPAGTTPPVGSTEVPPPAETTPPPPCNPADNPDTCPSTTASPPTTTAPGSETTLSAECNPGNPAYNSAACGTSTVTQGSSVPVSTPSGITTEVPPPAETTVPGTTPPAECTPGENSDNCPHTTFSSLSASKTVPPAVTTTSGSAPSTTEVSPVETTPPQAQCDPANPAYNPGSCETNTTGTTASGSAPTTTTVPPVETPPQQAQCDPANPAYNPGACETNPGTASTEVPPPSTPAGSSAAPTTTISPVDSTPPNPPASKTTSLAPPPPPPTDCPDLVPKCLKTWIFTTKCTDTADTKCFCRNKKFFEQVVDCINSWGHSDDEVKRGIEYFFGLCAGFVQENPEVVTCIPTSITLGPSTSTPTPPPPSPPGATNLPTPPSHSAPSENQPPPPPPSPSPPKATQTCITATITKIVQCPPTTVSGTVVTETPKVVETTLTVPRVSLQVTMTEAKLVYPPPPPPVPVTRYLGPETTQGAGYVTNLPTGVDPGVSTGLPKTLLTRTKVGAGPTGGNYTVPKESEGGVEGMGGLVWGWKAVVMMMVGVVVLVM